MTLNWITNQAKNYWRKNLKMASSGSLFDITLEFFHKLSEGRKQDVEHLFKTVKEVDLATLLNVLADFFMKLEGEIRNEFQCMELISDNFLQMLFVLLDWNRLSTIPESLLDVYNIFKALGCHFPGRKKALEEMGVFMRLFEILKNEKNNQSFICARQQNRPTIITAHFIADLLPTLPRSKCYEDVDAIVDGVLLSGPHFDGLNKFEENENELIFRINTISKTVYNICLMPNCLPVHHALLLKTIFWANALNKSCAVFEVQQVVNYVNMLMSSRKQEKVILGLAIVHTLLSKYPNSFHQIPETINSIRPIVGPFQWIEDISEIMIDDELRTPEMLIYCIQDKTFSSTTHLMNHLISSMLEFILPNYVISDKRSSDLKMNYSRLTAFIGCILNLPKDTDKVVGQLVVPTDGIQRFKELVTFVIRAVETNEVEQILDNYFSDFELAYVDDPETAEDVSLGLLQTQNFDTVLSPSLKANHLGAFPLFQSLRLAAIFQEVNENWGALFCSLTEDRLIDRSHFVSDSLVRFANVRGSDELCTASPMNLTNYFFLLPFNIRQEVLLNYVKENKDQAKQFCFSMKKLVDAVKIADLSKHSQQNSIFGLVQEFAREPRPTKEFYQTFSRECRKYDLDLWIGDPSEDSNGIAYIKSPGALFPKPKLSLTKDSELQLQAIGLILRKSFLDGHQVDIHFSQTLFKTMLFRILGNVPSLLDLKDVLPEVYKLVTNLVDALRLKWGIDKDESLTAGERMKAVQNIKCGGTSFEDLRLNFTIPCCPQMEMKEGGKDTPLTIESAEEYLKLLHWWVLHKGPEKSSINMACYFESNTYDDFLTLFYFDEIQSLFCDVKGEQWTVDYLKENCILRNGLSIKTKEVQHLFEVLASLSNVEQQEFLQFVTGSSRLPDGGLKNLAPKLTIRRKVNINDIPGGCKPSARSCSNALFIDKYKSKDILKEKLFDAIRNGK